MMLVMLKMTMMLMMMLMLITMTIQPAKFLSSSLPRSLDIGTSQGCAESLCFQIGDNDNDGDDDDLRRVRVGPINVKVPPWIIGRRQPKVLCNNHHQSDYDEYIARREAANKAKESEFSMKEDLDNLKGEINEIKSLLKELVNGN